MPLNRTCLCAEFYVVQKTPGSNQEKCQCPNGEVAANYTCMAPQNGKNFIFDKLLLIDSKNDSKIVTGLSANL